MVHRHMNVTVLDFQQLGIRSPYVNRLRDSVSFHVGAFTKSVEQDVQELLLSRFDAHSVRTNSVNEEPNKKK